jgi:hypothetical protein
VNAGWDPVLLTEQAKEELDSSLRWNDEQKLIQA